MHLFVEAKAKQDARGARRSRVGVDREQAIVNVAKPMGVVQISASSIKLARSTSAASTVSNGAGGPARRFLRNIAEPRPARHFDGSFIGVDQTDDGLHHGGLARAIPADQAHMGSRRNRGRCSVKYRASAEANRKAIDVQHDGARSSQSCSSQGSVLLRSGLASRGLPSPSGRRPLKSAFNSITDIPLVSFDTALSGVNCAQLGAM